MSATGLPKTSAFRYLATLEQLGYVERAADGGYRPARSFAPASAYDLERVAYHAQPLLTRLRDQFGETVSLGILDDWRATYVVTVKTHHSVRVEVQHGGRDRLHCTALGKALAADLPENRVRELLAALGKRRGMA